MLLPNTDGPAGVELAERLRLAIEGEKLRQQLDTAQRLHLPYPLLSDAHRTVAKDYGVYWPDWNANVRATFIVDPQGTVRFVERYGRGELPEPDKILAQVKKLG